MIAIFQTLLAAQRYSDKIHEYMTANRPGYNAVKWSDPVPASDNLSWWVKTPPDMPVIAELTPAIGKTVRLPDTGQITAGNYYQFRGDIIKCLQTHNRTEWEPKNTPALFTFFRDNSDQLEWIENEQIRVDWERIYNSVRYRCIQAHTTVKGLTPDITPALWNVVVITPVWTVGVLYRITNRVTYLGNSYRCLQQHTAIQSWNPVLTLNVLWKLI